MNEASISIIIPAYNVGSLLDRCMESVLAQTLTHIEILLINDGSTDNITAERCDYWGDKDDRVSVFHQQNQGLAQTCNIGVKRAKGTFIGFVDSDDWIDPRMFEELYKSVCTHNSDIAFCGVLLEDESGKIIEKQCSRGSDRVWQKDKALLEIMMDRFMRNYRWNKIFHRSLFEQIEFPRGRVFEDLNTVYRLFAGARNISESGGYYYHYMLRKGSIIGSREPLKEMDFFKANIERLEFINQYENFSEREKKMLSIRTLKRLLCSSHKIHRIASEASAENVKKEMKRVYSPDFAFDKYPIYILDNYMRSLPYLLNILL